MINRLASIVGKHVHSILVQMMTSDKDCKDTCPFRVWGTVGFLTIVGFMAYSIHKNGNFDPANYGGALAAYLLAWGGAILAKEKVSK